MGGWVRRAVGWVAAGLALAFTGPAVAAPVVISNGVVQLGVNDEGHLNVPAGTPGATRSTGGTGEVGLRFMQTNYEATAPGCLCEGWGLADMTSRLSGWANIGVDGGARNLDLVRMTATATTAVSVVDVRDLREAVPRPPIMRVTHDFHPSPVTPFLYEVLVTIRNISTVPVTPRYRRVMDWDIEPTAFREYVTARRGTAKELIFNSDDGFSTANPLVARPDPLRAGALGNFTDLGPADHGALFDFDFGTIAPGDSKSFRIFYGAAFTEGEALGALAAVEAEAYSMGQSSMPGGETSGAPGTFVFGFSGVGGTAVLPRSPSAEPDSLTTEAGVPGTVGVLDNDTDPNGDPLTVVGAIDGAHGTVSCLAAGACTYRPSGGYVGTDSFSYTVADSTGLAAVGTVSVTVRPAADVRASIGDVAVTEGDGGTVVAAFPVTLSAPAAATTSVRATASTGTAGVEDMVPDSVVVPFAAGQTTQTVRVTVLGDLVDEGDETFVVTLTDPVGLAIGDGAAVGTILDDDDGPPSVSVGDVVAPEASGAVTVALVLSAPSSSPVTVSVATLDGEAVHPADFTGHQGSVTFAPGEVSKAITVTLVDDQLDEADETLQVALSSPVGAVPGDLIGVMTIVDDDVPPAVSIADVTVTEGDAPSVDAVFTVTLSAPSGRPVSVEAATADGTATSPGDYSAMSARVAFAPGETSRVVPVTVIGDLAVEPDEAFTVALRSPVDTVFGDAAATGTILNDDAVVAPPPRLPLGLVKVASSVSTPAGGRNAYTITITNNNAVPVTVMRIVDCLPRWFRYLEDSTSGAVRTDPYEGRCGPSSKPGPAPRALMWRGRFVVPARGSLRMRFGVQVGWRAGTFRNSVVAVAEDGYTVLATGPTAPVRVVARKQRSGDDRDRD